MVDAPWLSPGEHSGAFFIFGHWALGIGHWALGMGHWALGIDNSSLSPPSPSSPERRAKS